MKVLWLTDTPVGASEYLGHKKDVHGWKTSLETHIKLIEGLELGVCFFYDNAIEFKFRHASVSYYPIKTKNSSLLGKIRSKLFNRLYDTNEVEVIKAINDFKPDVIQLFGTESGLGEVLNQIPIPHIIHLQGLINPCLAAWFPKGVTQQKILSNSSFKNRLLKKGVIGDYHKFKKMAVREEKILQNAKNFFGRTDWDRRTVSIYNKKANYYHCEELIRKPFFEVVWKPNVSKKLKLVTTINPQIYKGLEVVLQTAFLLKEKANFDFNWTIVGIDNSSSLVKVIERIEEKSFMDNNVVFEGYQNADNLIDLLISSDVFVHPSHIDNSPNSVCEAMLLGMPVIAGNVGGVPSLIQNGFNGVLYNSYDPYELAALLIETSLDSKTLVRLAKKARETAIERHDANEIIKTIKETYEELIYKNK